MTGQFTNDVVKLYSMKSRNKIVLSEKNLENIFRRAENRDWVLFFDEADAMPEKEKFSGENHYLIILNWQKLLILLILLHNMN